MQDLKSLKELPRLLKSLDHPAQGLCQLLNIALTVTVICDQGIFYRSLLFNVDPPIAYANTIRNTKEITLSDQRSFRAICNAWIWLGDGADLGAPTHRATQTNTCN